MIISASFKTFKCLEMVDISSPMSSCKSQTHFSPLRSSFTISKREACPSALKIFACFSISSFFPCAENVMSFNASIFQSCLLVNYQLFAYLAFYTNKFYSLICQVFYKYFFILDFTSKSYNIWVSLWSRVEGTKKLLPS